MHHVKRVLSHSSGLRGKLIKSFSKEIHPRCLSTLEQPPILAKAPQFSIPKEIVGQPTCHTHPHLIEPGYLTAGITQLEYRERRDNLMSRLAAEINNEHVPHVVVIPAARKQYMSDKIPYVYRQNSDFFYLTGCLEPSAVLVMIKPAHTQRYKALLFVHEKDAQAELWEGPRTGCAAAEKLFTVDEARPVDTFNNYLKKVTGTSKPSILWYRDDPPANPDLHGSVRSVLSLNNKIQLENPEKCIHFMRVIKSMSEVELMKQTCLIGAQSVNNAMAHTRPGVTEHEINSILEYSCKLAGAEHLAFPPVVAGGPRATHIHYIVNNQVLEENELLLVDTGCQRWYYNSDISRTWPVSGKFTKHQRILYELVLTVQKRLIQLLGEHRQPLDQLFDQMCRLLGVHLQQEGILPKYLKGNELLSRAYRLCPHHVSHYLGLDVHDSPLVRRHVPVENNMIVTVEPGIYINLNDTSVPEEFRGIGIRIEDDVLITSGDPLVLTESCVKEVCDIEEIVGKNTL